MPNKKQESVAASVKNYYDSHGWRRDEATGLPRDASCFLDLSESAQGYVYNHELAYRKYFAGGGQFFLDAGCGGEPRKDMSQDFMRHVCADISMVGLKEAAIKLGDSGSYVLADLAALPFKNLSFDGVLASHTLYHIAEELQPAVLRELVRVTGANKNVIVFYSSRHNLVSLIHKVPQMVLPIVNSVLYPFNLHVRRFSPYFRRAWKRYHSETEDVRHCMPILIIPGT